MTNTMEAVRTPEARAKAAATRKAKAEARRQTARRMFEAGDTIKKIADQLGVSDSTARSYVSGVKRGAATNGADLTQYLDNPKLLASVRGWTRARPRLETTTPLLPTDFARDGAYVSGEEFEQSLPDNFDGTPDDGSCQHRACGQSFPDERAFDQHVLTCKAQ